MSLQTAYHCEEGDRGERVGSEACAQQRKTGRRIRRVLVEINELVLCSMANNAVCRERIVTLTDARAWTAQH